MTDNKLKLAQKRERLENIRQQIWREKRNKIELRLQIITGQIKYDDALHKKLFSQ